MKLLRSTLKHIQKTVKMGYIYFLGVLAFIEMVFTPRLDKTSEGDILLWFNGFAGREYLKVW